MYTVNKLKNLRTVWFKAMVHRHGHPKQRLHVHMQTYLIRLTITELDKVAEVPYPGKIIQ